MKSITDLSVLSFVGSTEAKYSSTELNLGELISFRFLDMPRRLVDEGKDVYHAKTVGPVQGPESLRTSLSSKVSTCQNC
jgi:hypothetical protein